MFCPKCKYTSFDHLKKCPKCGYDWSVIRQALNLDWIVHPSDSSEETSESEKKSQTSGQSPLAKSERNASLEIDYNLSGSVTSSPMTSEKETDKQLFPANSSEYSDKEPLGGESEIDSEFLKDNELDTLDNILTPIADKEQDNPNQNRPNFDESSPLNLEGHLAENKDSSKQSSQIDSEQKSLDNETANNNEYILDYNELEQSLREYTLDSETSSQTHQTGQSAQIKNQNQDSENVEEKELDLSSLFNIIESDSEEKK